MSKGPDCRLQSLKHALLLHEWPLPVNRLLANFATKLCFFRSRKNLSHGPPSVQKNPSFSPVGKDHTGWAEHTNPKPIRGDDCGREIVLKKAGIPYAITATTGD